MTGRLPAGVVAGIKAAATDRSAGVRDIARAYGVSPSTVVALRAGARPDVAPLAEAPRLDSKRTPRGVLAADVLLLRKRGMTPDAIAAHLGVSVRTVYRASVRGDR